jgi:hypothetical protein
LVEKSQQVATTDELCKSLVQLPTQPRTGFASFDVFAQHGIDGRLVAAALLTEKGRDIRIKP